MAAALAAMGCGSGGRGHAVDGPGSLQYRRHRGLLRDHETVGHPPQRDPQQGAATKVKYKLSQSVGTLQFKFLRSLDSKPHLPGSLKVNFFDPGKCHTPKEAY